MNTLEEMKRYFRNAGITQASIAEAFNTTSQYISGVLNGKLTLGKKNALKFQELYGINAAWILTGEGKMLLDAPDPEPEPDKEAVIAGLKNRIGELEGQLEFYRRQIECLQKVILNERGG